MADYQVYNYTKNPVDLIYSDGSKHTIQAGTNNYLNLTSNYDNITLASNGQSIKVNLSAMISGGVLRLVDNANGRINYTDNNTPTVIEFGQMSWLDVSFATNEIDKWPTMVVLYMSFNPPYFASSQAAVSDPNTLVFKQTTAPTKFLVNPPKGSGNGNGKGIGDKITTTATSIPTYVIVIAVLIFIALIFGGGLFIYKKKSSKSANSSS